MRRVEVVGESRPGRREGRDEGKEVGCCSWFWWCCFARQTSHELSASAPSCPVLRCGTVSARLLSRDLPQGKNNGVVSRSGGRWSCLGSALLETLREKPTPLSVVTFSSKRNKPEPLMFHLQFYVMVYCEAFASSFSVSTRIGPVFVVPLPVLYNTKPDWREVCKTCILYQCSCSGLYACQEPAMIECVKWLNLGRPPPLVHIWKRSNCLSSYWNVMLKLLPGKR